MENYQMNRSGCRPYNRTCGMMNSTLASGSPRNLGHNNSSQQISCNKSDSTDTKGSMYEHLKHLTPAMAYVPYQQFTTAYELNYALSVGTVFPQLCKPFCGKRGVRR